MSAIIILTIGPVQGYISQARRTQDLWQSSRILSYLAAAGVQYAVEAKQQGLAELVYPLVDIDRTESIPNRIVVTWNGDISTAQDFASQMANAIHSAWSDVSENTLEYLLSSFIPEPPIRDSVKEIWHRQAEDWLECYWVVVPEDSQHSYADNLTRADEALGCRKLLRAFPQIHEHGRKCSITGEHEVLHGPRDSDPSGAILWSTIRESQANVALFGRSERLSAISTIKRLAHEERRSGGVWTPINPGLEISRRFPSTSSIAASPFKYDVLLALDGQLPDSTEPQAISDAVNARQELARALENYIAALRKLFQNPDDLFFNRRGDYNEEYFGLIEHTVSDSVLDDGLIRQFRSIDGDFLFEDTLIGKTIEEYSKIRPSESSLKTARQALSELISRASDFGIQRPQPYLVVLAMDGDHMGRTLGTLLNSVQHRRFSRTLAEFARNNAIRIVERDHLGRMVYAGGDDVLALLPVRDALQAAEELRFEFQRAIEEGQILDIRKMPITAHASCGLAYVHHTHNLQDAVYAASTVALEHIAKGSYGRNAIGIQMLRRSGEPRQMGQRWMLGGSPLVSHLTSLISAFAAGKLSRNLPTDLSQIAYSMTSASLPDAARELELQRVLGRRLDSGAKADKQSIAEQIMALADSHSGDLECQWRNVQRWLELARFIAQKESDR